MAKQAKDRTKYVKQHTLLITALVAFLGGVFIGAYLFGPGVSEKTSLPPQQPAQIQSFPAEQHGRILALEKQATLNPESVEIWTQLGNLYFDSNNFVKAIRAYQKSLELDPNNANVWTDMGVMYRRSGQPTEAIKAFDRAIEIDPSHETSRFNKGVVLMHDLNDSKNAIRAWEELHKVNPFYRAPSGEPLKQMIADLKSKMNQ